MDIRGHDGVIYKGRIDAGKLPTVDMQKKNTVVLLTPPPPSAPPQRQRSDLNLPSPHHQTSLVGEQNPNNISTTIPNFEPNLPREETFT